MANQKIGQRFSEERIVYLVHCRTSLLNYFVHAVFETEEGANAHVARFERGFIKWLWFKRPEFVVEARAINP